MTKKATAQQIIDNINAKIALYRAQGLSDKAFSDLQELIEDICRHNMGITPIDAVTEVCAKGATKYRDGKYIG